MIPFEYDRTGMNAEYYETLISLMERWETEIVEFKEAKGQYSDDKIGQYFSAISNEANLKQQQYGWFVLGVSETKDKHVVGSAYKKGDRHLEKFKYEISRDLTDGISFIEIIELYPVVDGKELRVVMFKIPAATLGMPTAWKTRYYARNGDSLVPLSQGKIDMIRMQERRDWSKQLVYGSSIDYLDSDAIALAKEKYIEKMDQPHIKEEVKDMTDEQFLTKIKLMVNGQLTKAALLLLGKEEHDNLFETAPVIMWRLYAANGEVRDYKIFKIPFLFVVDQVFAKIRNLTYRYMPNQLTLFPKETEQYDQWLLRELLNNCIAHSNYQLGGRIYINEFDDCIKITNPGNFIPGSIESVLQISYNPPFYRNQLLADTMVNFHMIDTASMGIRKVFRIQREKYFPMPDYDLTKENEVAVTVHGKTLNERYTQILYSKPELDLETVYLLDQVQKGLKISADAVKYLRKHKLVEGRVPNLYLSAAVAQSISDEAQYIRNKSFDDQYYRDMIVGYIRQYGSAQKKDIKALLWDKLSDVLTEEQKNSKITTLLTSLRMKGIIKTDSPNQQRARWILTNNEDSNKTKK